MEVESLYQRYIKSTGVNTDSRNIQPNQLFFALKGDKFDGNIHAEAALNAGACVAVVDDSEVVKDSRYVLVKNALESLQQLAAFHRSKLDIPVIGLTGSNGKTTNKELLARVLGEKFKVHATLGNLNNHIGVPLTLLTMPVETEIAIIEMGANHQGEIAALCEICKPNYGFITNLGKAHLEGFGGVEEVKKGKGELFDFLKNNNATAFINSKNEDLKALAVYRNMLLVVYYGDDERALRADTFSPVIQFETPEEGMFSTYLSGTYNFENMQTAYAIGRFFGVSSEGAGQAIANYNPENNRSQVIEKGNNMFLMDAYNANPSSMEAAILNFSQLKTQKKKTVILGDMFELGKYSDQEHEKLGRLVAEQNFDTVVFYGENLKHGLQYNSKAFYFTDKFSLHNWLADRKFSDTYFLVKGSRGVGLESVLSVFSE